MLLTLRKKFICSTVLHTVFVLFALQLAAALPFSMRTSSTLGLQPTALNVSDSLLLVVLHNKSLL